MSFVSPNQHRSLASKPKGMLEGEVQILSGDPARAEVPQALENSQKGGNSAQKGLSTMRISRRFIQVSLIYGVLAGLIAGFSTIALGYQNTWKTSADAVFHNHIQGVGGCAYSEFSILINDDLTSSGQLNNIDNNCVPNSTSRPLYTWTAGSEMKVSLKSPTSASIEGDIVLITVNGEEKIPAHIHIVWTDLLGPQKLITEKLDRHGPLGVFQNWRTTAGNQVNCIGSLDVPGHPQLSYVTLDQGWCTLPYEQRHTTWARP